jgi:hypothetical protein
MSQQVSELLRRHLRFPPSTSFVGRVSPQKVRMTSWTNHPKKNGTRRSSAASQKLDSGKVKPIPWAKARRRITALLHGR